MEEVEVKKKKKESFVTAILGPICTVGWWKDITIFILKEGIAALVTAFCQAMVGEFQRRLGRSVSVNGISGPANAFSQPVDNYQRPQAYSPPQSTPYSHYNQYSQQRAVNNPNIVPPPPPAFSPSTVPPPPATVTNISSSGTGSSKPTYPGF